MALMNDVLLVEKIETKTIALNTGTIKTKFYNVE